MKLSSTHQCNENGTVLREATTDIIKYTYIGSTKVFFTSIVSLRATKHGLSRRLPDIATCIVVFRDVFNAYLDNAYKCVYVYAYTYIRGPAAVKINVLC